MTALEYRDALLEASRTGGFPSKNEKNSCQYLSADGRRCAAGLLIPPERYSKEMESRCASHDLLFGKALADLTPEGLTANDLDFVQMAHDEQRFSDAWDHAEFSAQINNMPCFKNL